MRAKILVLIVLLFLLTSCNALPSFGGNELLEAPLLNQVQQQVYEGLSTTVNPSILVYKYPASGNYRSPFVFYDINGDGNDEVIVFHAYKDNENLLTAQVLIQDKGEWVHFWNIGGKGNYVDFVDFAPLVQGEESNLIIGWGKEDQLEKTIVVYSMGGTAIKPVFTESYLTSYITPKNSQGLSQLALAQSSGETFQMALYGKRGNSLKEIHTYPLYEETSKVLQMLPEIQQDGSVYMYIDEELGSGTVSYGTEVFKIFSGIIRPVVGGERGLRPEESTPQWKAFEDTFRKTRVLSVDLTGDGLIKVPRVKESSESDKEKPSNIILIEYVRLNDEGEFQLRHTTITNEKSGYMIYYPDRWIGNVAIVKDPLREEWRIHKIDEATGEPGIELFRIRVYFYFEYIDEFAKDDILLGTRGLHSYYGTIPETSNEPLAITPEEATEIFALTR